MTKVSWYNPKISTKGIG